MIEVFGKSGIKIGNIDDKNEIARGGEGFIVDFGADSVAKIYLPNITPITECRFIELSELKSNCFIKPEQLLYNKSGKIIGFSMKKISSDYFPLLSLFNKGFCQRAGITDSIKRNIIDRIIDGVKFAHSKNIVIGDLNPFNILVNDKGIVYYIDVDSYQTETYKHSGILLDDIRDFLYNGDVTMKSDYFALSVLCFNLLTYVHPFKGVDKAMPRLSDRMIKKRSILSCTDIIIPKCYEQITDANLLAQFTSIFNGGDRFPITLSDTVANINKTSNKTKVQSINGNASLNIKLVKTFSKFNRSFNSKNRIALLSDNTVTVYDASIKDGLYEMYSNCFDNIGSVIDVFICNNDIYINIGNEIYDAKTMTSIFTMNFGNIKKMYMLNTILVVITDNYMYKVNLSNKIAGNIIYDKVEVFGSSFNCINGLCQKAGSSSILFYEKSGVNSSVVNGSILDVYQKGNCGVIRTLSNESISHKYFTIKNLNIELFDCDIDCFTRFDELNDDIIVVPKDNILSLVRKSDMLSIVEYSFDGISAGETSIHCTKAGIFAISENEMFLINKK